MQDDEYDDEDYAQIDGEPRARVDFVPNTSQPWLRTPQPPWHMWGTTESVPTSSFGGGFAPPINGSAQLVKINYKRPETWHWIFYIRLLQGQPTDVSQFGQTQVHFDVTVGLGRASVTMLQFETLTIQWDPIHAAPIGQAVYSTEVYAPNRIFGGTPLPIQVKDNIIRELVAQDIQVSCRVINGSNFVNDMVTEVGAFFAPKTHIRPDWQQQRSPIEMQFPGDEVQGR